MPLVFLEQLPLPSLQSYVTVSVLLFVSAILFSLNVTIGSGESDVPKIYDFMSQDNFCFWVSMFTTALIRRYYFTPDRFVLTFALSMFYFQSNLNMAYCCLFLFGKIIQRVVFGDLRASELQVRTKGRRNNFVCSNGCQFCYYLAF